MARQFAFLAVLISLVGVWGDGALASPPETYISRASEFLGPQMQLVRWRHRYRRDDDWNTRAAFARGGTDGFAGSLRLAPREGARSPRRRGEWVDPPPLE
jgi:hypothetical protein